MNSDSNDPTLTSISGGQINIPFCEVEYISENEICVAPFPYESERTLAAIRLDDWQDARSCHRSSQLAVDLFGGWNPTLSYGSSWIVRPPLSSSPSRKPNKNSQGMANAGPDETLNGIINGQESL